MADLPELADFRKRSEDLLRKKPLKRVLRRGKLALSELTTEDVQSLLEVEAGKFLLLAAANLNRTSLKKAMVKPEAQVFPKATRRARVILERLPVAEVADLLVDRSVALRARDLNRKKRSQLEEHFKDRLEAEGIPLLMSPPLRKVPGLLISMRKPDGIAPDPATEAPPKVYLEIKNIRRVADDIQKRLYEIAEVSLEMKLLYGGLQVKGMKLTSTADVERRGEELRERLRSQIVRAKPVVVAFFLCPRTEAEKYRAGAEAFIDHVFFQEEVEECLELLRRVLGSKR